MTTFVDAHPVARKRHKCGLCRWWMEVTDGLWQLRRQSQAFSKDGGKTYRLNDDRDTLHTAGVSGRGGTEECNQEEHEHRHQWRGDDYVCDCGDVAPRGLWK